MDPASEKILMESFKSMSASEQEELLVKLANTYKGRSEEANDGDTSSDDEYDEEQQSSDE